MLRRSRLAGQIDEFHLFINPVAIGSGLTIKQNLTLAHVNAFDCNIVVVC